MVFKAPSFKQVGLALIGSFFLIQIISLLLTALIPSIPLFKGGSILLIILLSVGVMTLFIVGIKFDELKSKENIFFVVLVFALLGLGYYFLPTYFPQLFSISPEASVAIKNTLGSILGGMR